MVARGEFGHNAAVSLVQIDLGMQGVGEQAALAVVDGDAGFIAGGFDAEDAHGGILAAGANFLLDFAANMGKMFGFPSNPSQGFRLGQIRKSSMPGIRLKENEPFEVAIRRFKRAIEKTGILTELRAREFYEKPTSERKRKLAAAVKRHHKRIHSQQLPPKMY